MKKFPIYLLMAMSLSLVAVSCSLDTSEDEDDDVAAWRTANSEWYLAQKALTNPDGTPFYTEVVPAWNGTASILMHWFNDRSATAGNLMPLETSTVDVKYILHNYKGEALDSSYLQQTSAGDSIFRTKVTSVDSGWQIALQSMHVGDSVRVVLPYTEGYGSSATTSIPAYSALEFDIKLVDIPYYEVRP